MVIDFVGVNKEFGVGVKVNVKVVGAVANKLSVSFGPKIKTNNSRIREIMISRGTRIRDRFRGLEVFDGAGFEGGDGGVGVLDWADSKG